MGASNEPATADYAWITGIRRLRTWHSRPDTPPVVFAGGFFLQASRKNTAAGRPHSIPPRNAIPVRSSEHIAKPVLIGILSATIQSRGRDSCSGLVFACTTVLDGGLAWCLWCPLTSEFGSMGLKWATQAKRLNLRKASKYAGFRLPAQNQSGVRCFRA